MPFYVNVYTEMKFIYFLFEHPPDVRNGVQNLKHFFFFWPRYVACRIFVPQPGIEPRQWKHGVLTLDCQSIPEARLERPEFSVNGRSSLSPRIRGGCYLLVPLGFEKVCVYTEANAAQKWKCPGDAPIARTWWDGTGLSRTRWGKQQGFLLGISPDLWKW